MKVLRLTLVILFGLFLALIIFLGVVFRDRRPSIYFAAEEGDTNYLGRYLASGHNVNAPVIDYHYGHSYAPLLSIAVPGGRSNAVEFLLSNGADPNQEDSHGDTPLMWIGQMGHAWPKAAPEIVRILLARGADPNFKRHSRNQDTPFLGVVRFAGPDIVAILIASGANVNATNKHGESALHVTRNADVARLLIAAGANLNARAEDGETPADYAARLRSFDVWTVITNSRQK